MPAAAISRCTSCLCGLGVPWGRGPVAPRASQGLVQGSGGVERGAQLGILRRERRQPRRLPAGGVGAGGKALRQRRLLARQHRLRSNATPSNPEATQGLPGVQGHCGPSRAAWRRTALSGRTGCYCGAQSAGGSPAGPAGSSAAAGHTGCQGAWRTQRRGAPGSMASCNPAVIGTQQMG